MITVCHIIDTGGPGGAETVFMQTATRLDRTIFKSIPVVSKSGWLSEQIRHRGLEARELAANGSFNLPYLAGLLKLIRDSGTDVVVAHLYGAGIYASLAGKILTVPVISVLHGQTDVSDSGRLASLKAAILRHGSQHVVFVSERLRDDLQATLQLPASKCVVIPNGVDTHSFRPSGDNSLRRELGLADDTWLVGAVGNARKPKAYDVLLRSAQILLGRSRRYHFAIAGDCGGPLGVQLQQLTRDFGISEHVSWLGLRADIPRVLNGLNAFALSSTTEGFSIACIEAMACGIPVVATCSGGPEEILAGGNGILVPSRDPEALAHALEQLASAPEFASSLRASAMLKVHREYSLATMIGRYETLLARVAGKAAPSRSD